ncbi:integrase/recombinase XerC [Amycolatopsis arida]|uniref:Integrase/recombinase XerC n=1 Tax=Amycolatopsis arida TaxID=587909 RepID=A0A1I5ZF24_9PSEU|nr:tyrosine-type recombinase/integrase [Amycolatopsis arida]TDX89606.1 integrase/recombinase XerC [Amycolatopsis arida]SFQ55021.1 integrase/recombinase XerC [Amycolatopsis arida]
MTNSPFPGTLVTSGAGRDALVEAVALLPALPPADPTDRYAVRHVTALWLAADKSEHTRRAYYADLAAWLSWCDRTGLDPLRARRADVDAWKATLTVTGRDGRPRPAAPATVARTLAGVSSWYRYLQSNDVTDTNPIGAVTRPKRPKASPLPALDEASTAALLDHAEARARRNGTEASWRDAALVALLFYTGLRVSGVTGALVSDLDVDSGHTILRYTGKGGQRDVVPLVAPALRPLGEYLAVRAARAGVEPARLSGPLLATAPHPHDPARPGGKPLRQRDVWETLRRLARQAGLPAAGSISPHTARRTAGTVLLAHDVPVQKVQDLLGHADIRTTRDRYDAHRHKLDSSPAHTLAQILAARRRG